MSPEQRHNPNSPAEAMEQQIEQIPDEVFLVFNALIAQNLYNGRSRVKQNDVVEILVQQGFDKSEIFKKHWLDVEDGYRKAGWKVEYDKPAYNESYDPSFRFTDTAKG